MINDTNSKEEQKETEGAQPYESASYKQIKDSRNFID